MKPRGDEAFSDDVFEIEQVVVALLSSQNGQGRLRNERLRRLVVRASGRNGNQFFFRITERRKFSAEDATGVDVNSAIQPFGLGDRGMAVDDGGLAAVVSGPVVTDGETKLVDFARGFPEEREIAHGGGPATLHLFLHAGVGDNEAASIENVVADERVKKPDDLLAKFRRLLFELLESFDDAVSQLHVFSSQLAKQLDVVISRNGEGVAGGDHLHDEAKHRGRIWTAIDEIAEEHGLPAGRRQKEGRV